MIVCGGDFRPGYRDECPNPLHDWPLPNGYTDAAETAGRRLRRRWSNPRCPDCGLFGWIPGNLNPGEKPTPAGCPSCGHEPHATGLCVAQQHPACDCPQDEDDG